MSNMDDKINNDRELAENKNDFQISRGKNRYVKGIIVCCSYQRYCLIHVCYKNQFSRVLLPTGNDNHALYEQASALSYYHYLFAAPIVTHQTTINELDSCKNSNSGDKSGILDGMDGAINTMTTAKMDKGNNSDIP